MKELRISHPIFLAGERFSVTNGIRNQQSPDNQAEPLSAAAQQSPNFREAPIFGYETPLGSSASIDFGPPHFRLSEKLTIPSESHSVDFGLLSPPAFDRRQTTATDAPYRSQLG